MRIIFPHSGTRCPLRSKFSNAFPNSESSTRLSHFWYALRIAFAQQFVAAFEHLQRGSKDRLVVLDFWNRAVRIFAAMEEVVSGGLKQPKDKHFFRISRALLVVVFP